MLWLSHGSKWKLHLEDWMFGDRTRWIYILEVSLWRWQSNSRTGSRSCKRACWHRREKVRGWALGSPTLREVGTRPQTEETHKIILWKVTYKMEKYLFPGANWFALEKSSIYSLRYSFKIFIFEISFCSLGSRYKVCLISIFQSKFQILQAVKSPNTLEKWGDSGRLSLIYETYISKLPSSPWLALESSAMFYKAKSGICQQMNRWKDHWNTVTSLKVDSGMCEGVELWYRWFLNSPDKDGFLNKWWWDHSHLETDKTDPHLMSCSRINSEWIRDLNF